MQLRLLRVPQYGSQAAGERKNNKDSHSHTPTVAMDKFPGPIAQCICLRLNRQPFTVPLKIRNKGFGRHIALVGIFMKCLMGNSVEIPSHDLYKFKIGRASCRESVYIGVVGGTLK